jgi:hypothetical protein
MNKFLVITLIILGLLIISLVSYKVIEKFSMPEYLFTANDGPEKLKLSYADSSKQSLMVRGSLKDDMIIGQFDLDSSTTNTFSSTRYPEYFLNLIINDDNNDKIYTNILEVQKHITGGGFITVGVFKNHDYMN